MTPAEYSALDPVWIVKTGDRILGPFTVEELTVKLFEREIVVIDEVSTPGRRWRYVRDEPLLAKVVEEVRKGQMNTREDTEVGTSSETETMTEELTQTQTDTQTPIHVGGRSSHPRENIRDVTPSASVIHEASRSSPSASIRQYGTGQDARVKKEVSRASLVMWTFATLIFLVAGILVLRMQGIGENSGDFNEYNRHMLTAQTFLTKNKPRDALQEFREAAKLRPREVSAALQVAELMLQVEPNRSMEAARQFEELAARSEANPEERRRAKLGAAVGWLVANNFSRARELFQDLQRERSGRRETWHALVAFNQGVLNFREKKVQQAGSDFYDAQGLDPDLAASWLLRSLAAVESSTGQPNWRSGLEIISEFISSGAADFRQEATLFKAFFQMQTGDLAAAANTVSEVLEADPFITPDHYHDPLLVLEDLSWSGRLMDMCEKLHTRLETLKSDFIDRRQGHRSLLALCLTKADRQREAFRVIDDSLRKRNQLTLLHAVQAFGHYTAHSESVQVNVSLKQAGERTPLADYVRGRMCLESRPPDKLCLREVYQAYLGRSGALSAWVGAGVAYAGSDNTKAASYLERSKRASPRYRPIRILEAEVQ